MSTAPALCPRDHTCPATTSHDTYSAYRVGCPSPAARADAARYRKARMHSSTPPRRRVPSVGARRRLQALAALGWHFKAMAERCGLNDQQLGRIARGHASPHYLYATTDRAIRDLYADLSMTVGPSNRARNDARRAGWVPPLAWDDDQLDATHAVPRGVGASNRDLALEADVRRLAADGATTADIARQLGRHHRVVGKVRERLARDEEAA